MRLRNMTGLYLARDGRMLLLYREGGRVVNHVWVASAGGHFEPEELNDPERCALRELEEELGLRREDLEDMRLRYVGLRCIGGEIRQNYYYFAMLKPQRRDPPVSKEGRCEWVALDDVLDYEMPLTARKVMEHYMAVGRFTDRLYAAVSGADGFAFVEMREE